MGPLPFRRPIAAVSGGDGGWGRSRVHPKTQAARWWPTAIMGALTRRGRLTDAARCRSGIGQARRRTRHPAVSPMGPSAGPSVARRLPCAVLPWKSDRPREAQLAKPTGDALHDERPQAQPPQPHPVLSGRRAGRRRLDRSRRPVAHQNDNGFHLNLKALPMARDARLVILPRKTKEQTNQEAGR